MPRLTPSRLLIALLLCATTAGAEEKAHVDPRYPYSVDAFGSLGYLSSLSGLGASQLTLGANLDLAFPVSEGRQIVVGATAVTGTSATGNALEAGGSAGYRILTFWESWRTRLDLQVAADYTKFVHTGNVQGVEAGFGLGVRVALGVQYYFFTWLGLGAELGVSAYVIKVHFLLAIGPVLTANW